MRNVEPQVYIIARTKIDHDETYRWLSDLGADKYIVRLDRPDGENLVQLAGRRCYMSFVVGKLNPNITKIRKEAIDYIDNILSSGHGSTLEHVNFTFAIENVSRIFTGEMNRHRAGMAISEGSQRYIRFTDIPWWIPTSIRPDPGDDTATRDRKLLTQMIFNKAFAQMEQNYRELEGIWNLDGVKADSVAFKVKKKMTSLFRRIVGMGVATGGIWTGNVRSLRHVLTMRCDPAAEEEILLVATMMLEKMREAEPLLFGDFSFDEETQSWKPKYRKV